VRQRVGTHIVADLNRCQYLPEGHEWLQKVALAAAKRANMQVIGVVARTLHPGATVVVGLAESHLSVHTWPEYGYAAVDIFTCGYEGKAWVAYQVIKDILRPHSSQLQVIERTADCQTEMGCGVCS